MKIVKNGKFQENEITKGVPGKKGTLTNKKKSTRRKLG